LFDHVELNAPASRFSIAAGPFEVRAFVAISHAFVAISHAALKDARYVRNQG
jgi:hypothetical protein